MNEELQKNVSEILEFLKKGADSASSFAAEQAPLFVTEYLNWYFYSHIFFVIVFAIIMCLLIMFGRKAYKMWEDDGFKDGPIILPVVAFPIIAFGMFICSLCDTYECIKVSVAPRVVLLEKVIELSKSVK